MLFRYGETSTLGVLETHVQPTFNTPFSPEAVQESDTPQTPQHDHDNCQNQNLPDTVPNSTTTQELVVSIPIDFEFKMNITKIWQMFLHFLRTKLLTIDLMKLNFHQNTLQMPKIIQQVLTMNLTDMITS